MPFRDFIQNMSQALSKCLSKWINGIIWKIPHRNLRNLFVKGFLWIPRKTGRQNWRGPIFKVQSGKITVWQICNFVHCFICQHYVSIKVFLTLEKTKERMRRTLFQVLFPLLSFSVHNGIKKFWIGFWSFSWLFVLPKHFCTLWNSEKKTAFLSGISFHFRPFIFR